MIRKAILQLQVQFDDAQISHPYRWDWTAFVNTQGVYCEVLKCKTFDVAAPSALSIESLDIKHLHALVFGTPNTSARSIHPTDNPVERVRVVSYDLGRMIAEADPSAEYFHVELFPPNSADLWSAWAWQQSTTRRLRHLSATVNSDLPTLRQHVFNELTHLITSKARCPTERAQSTATALINFGDGNDMLLDLMETPLDLRNKLYQLRKLLTQQ